MGVERASAAGPEAAPFQVSLTQELQVFAADESVRGARFGLISARNQDVVGFDGVLFASLTSGDQTGLQLSIYAEVGGTLRGVQLGVLRADVEGDATGLQVSNIATRAASLVGAQISSLYNRAHAVRGLQIALVNDAHDLEGLQIGILNLNRNGWLPIVPFLNVGF